MQNIFQENFFIKAAIWKEAFEIPAERNLRQKCALKIHLQRQSSSSNLYGDEGGFIVNFLLCLTRALRHRRLLKSTVMRADLDEYKSWIFNETASFAILRTFLRTVCNPHRFGHPHNGCCRRTTNCDICRSLEMSPITAFLFFFLFNRRRGFRIIFNFWRAKILWLRALTSWCYFGKQTNKTASSFAGNVHSSPSPQFVIEASSSGSLFILASFR